MNKLVLPFPLSGKADFSLALVAGDKGSTVITKHYSLMNNEKADVSMRYLVRDYFQRPSLSESER
ncbi:hypothetical protein [Thalassomonas actiniarum]|uniref:Uncharacterized protein n=1 Tax=Thalassomonas actiniarum TaxID=485447 RepID=A0AAE9YPL4_9GAMM|nr:hypothetical protein [Thalassomonas actiniarum]WDD98461.1 hypothetical protein SG35_024915 [Thalassomonas actiniarum]